VNSIISGIAVLGAELFQSLGVPPSRSHKNAAFAAAFAQSPNGGLVVDGASLRILGANETIRGQLEVSEAELQNLTLNVIFEYDCRSEILLARLRGPDPKSPRRRIAAVASLLPQALAGVGHAV
jgi:hypothetical protein